MGNPLAWLEKEEKGEEEGEEEGGGGGRRVDGNQFIGASRG